MKKIFRGFLLFLFLTIVGFSLSACGRNNRNQEDLANGIGNERVNLQGQEIRVSLIHFADIEPSKDAESGILEVFEEEEYLNGRIVQFHSSNANGDMELLEQLIDQAQNDQTNLYIATSTPALQALMERIKNVPIVFTNIADPILAGAGETNEKHEKNVTGVFVMADFEGMLDHLLEMTPDVKKIGTVYNPEEANAVSSVKLFSEAAKERNMELVAIPAKNVDELKLATRQLTEQNVEVICQILDNLSAGYFQLIAEVAEEEGLPLLGFDSAQINQGALATLSRDFKQGGRDAAGLAIRIMKGESPENISFQLLEETNLFINRNKAPEFGITIPSSLLDQAELVLRY
jgi:ABC-type uncharacterized transport system substrate-binding protein